MNGFAYGIITRSWVRVLVAVSLYLESLVRSRKSVQRSVQQDTKSQHEASEMRAIQAASDQHQLSCTHGAGQTVHLCLHHHQNLLPCCEHSYYLVGYINIDI
jgi:hypothetical protein